MAATLERLGRLCRRWGGELVFKPEEPFWHEPDGDGISYAPFEPSGLAVNWEQFRIYYSLPTLVEGIIHEMGHVFACPHEPQCSDELDFFGWEYALARRLGHVKKWVYSNRNYSVGLSELGELTDKEKQGVLNERLNDARIRGLVVGDAPKPIRLGPGGKP